MCIGSYTLLGLYLFFYRGSEFCGVSGPFQGSHGLLPACILGLCRVQQGQPAAASSALKKALQQLGHEEMLVFFFQNYPVILRDRCIWIAATRSQGQKPCDIGGAIIRVARDFPRIFRCYFEPQNLQNHRVINGWSTYPTPIKTPRFNSRP